MPARLLVRLTAIVCAGGMLWFASAAQGAPPSVGGLQQVPGPAHCLTPSGNTGACTAWPTLGSPLSIAITPDGRFAYVASTSPTNGALLVAARNPVTGALTPASGTAGCYSDDGSSSAGPNTCATVPGVGTNYFDLKSVVVSSDGRYLYLASAPFSEIVVFSIDATSGALTEVSCVSTTGTSGCTQSVSVTDAESLTLSPDGHTLYESSYTGSAISAFSIDPTAGALTQISGVAGCVSTSALGSCRVDSQMNGPGPVVISPDGAWLRVATYNNSSLLAYPIVAGGGLGVRPDGGSGCVQDGPATSSCPNLSPLDGAYDIASSPAGNQLYVGLFNANGVTSLSTPSGSAPTLIGCTLEPPGASPCNSGAGLDTVNSVVASPDGHAVYFAAEGDPSSGDPNGAVTAFQRDPSTGALSQYAGAAGCQLSSPPPSGTEAACGADPTANGPYAIAVSPDSNFVYALGLDASNNGWLTVYYATAAPSCQSANVSVTGGQTVTLPLTCTDRDGNPITLSITSGPSHGTVAAIDQRNQTVSYTAARGYNGSDAVTFTASDGTNNSAPATVQLSIQSPPSAVTLSATNVSRRSARLNGTVNPNGVATSYYFQYGTTTSYGSQTAPGPAGSDTAAHAEAASITNLRPGTTYHFRIVATSASGASYGVDVTFKATALAPTQVRIRALTASPLGRGCAVERGDDERELTALSADATCRQLRLTLRGTIQTGGKRASAGGTIRVSYKVKLPRGATSGAKRATVTHGRWQISLVLPAVNLDPVPPSYLITVHYGGDATLQPAGASRRIRLESERPGL